MKLSTAAEVEFLPWTNGIKCRIFTCPSMEALNSQVSNQTLLSLLIIFQTSAFKYSKLHASLNHPSFEEISDGVHSLVVGNPPRQLCPPKPLKKSIIFIYLNNSTHFGGREHQAVLSTKKL